MPLISSSAGAGLVTIVALASAVQDAEAHVLRKPRAAHAASHAVQNASGVVEKARLHPAYDHEAYAKSWHEEWEAGDFPNWRITNRHAYRILRHMHPVEPGPQVLHQCISEIFPSFDRAFVAMVVGMGSVCGLCWMIAGRITSVRRAAGREVAAAAATASNSRRPNLDCLDGLRTILIGYIVLFHLRYHLPPHLFPYFSTGHWAVQFFFVLSGFVSFYGVEGQFAAFDKQRAAKFLLRRIVRLCPAYFAALLWLGTLARFGLYAALPFLAWPIAAVFGQTLFPALVCGDVDPSHWSHNSLGFGGNPMGWFVSCIMVCSVFFPILYNVRPWTGLRGTFFVLLIVLLARSAPTIAEMALNHIPRTMEDSVFDTQTHSFNVYTFAPMRLLEFAAGALTAQLCSQLPLQVQGWSGWAWTFDTSLALVWVVKGAVVKASPGGPPFGDYMVSGLFCLTCAAARGVSEHERQCEEPECYLTGGLLVRLLSLRPLVWLAEYSYGAFIYEEPVFRSTTLLLGITEGQRRWWLLTLATWAAGALSLHLLELPVRRVIERRLNSERLLPVKASFES